MLGALVLACATLWAGLLTAICRHATGTAHYFCAYLDRRAPTAVYPFRGDSAYAIDAATGNIYTPGYSSMDLVFFSNSSSLHLAVFCWSP